MQIDEQALQQITVDVCQTMLGLPLSPISPQIDTTHQLVASVEIHGTPHAVVEVFAHNDLMTAIAEAMFCSDRGSLPQEEIRDAFGEIANMIGGNVKGSFGDECSLSLPVIGSANDQLGNPENRVLLTTFECCGHPLTIVLREFAPADETESHISANPQ